MESLLYSVILYWWWSLILETSLDKRNRDFSSITLTLGEDITLTDVDDDAEEDLEKVLKKS